jgi:hypothetical protein
MSSDALGEVIENWNRLYCSIEHQRQEVLKYKIRHYDRLIESTLRERNKVMSNFNLLIDDLKKNMSNMDVRNLNTMELLMEKTNFMSLQKRLQVFQNIRQEITEQQKEEGRMQELYNDILELWGREGQQVIKNLVADLLLAFAKSGVRFMTSIFLNFLIMGQPGIGKTRYATLIAPLLGNLGILVYGDVNIVSRQDFVGQFVGDTAIKTEDLLFNNLEKALVIDEAYLLGGYGQKGDYGAEAIGAMVNFLDKNKGMIVIFALGYPEAMQEYFLNVNAGMPRRFPFKITLTEYSAEELQEILLTMIQSGGLEHVEKLPNSELFARAVEEGLFVNQAGDMENIASILVRRILSSGGRAVTESALVYAMNEYLMSTGELQKHPVLMEEMEEKAMMDITVHERARTKFQLSNPECAGKRQSPRIVEKGEEMRRKRRRGPA